MPGRRRLTIAAGVALSAALAAFAHAQAPLEKGGAVKPRPLSAPTTRWPGGHPMLGAPGQIGYWNLGTGSLTGQNGNNLPTNLDLNEVPFQPLARALYQVRRQTQSKDNNHDTEHMVGQ